MKDIKQSKKYVPALLRETHGMHIVKKTAYG